MRTRSIVVTIAAALLAACTTHADEDDRIPLTGDLPEEGAVDVALEDYVVDPDTAETVAGDVVFVATNEGEVPHELQVAVGEDPDELPTTTDGSVDQAALGEDLLGATDELARGDSGQLALTLAEGSYVLFCNLDDHFERGMAIPFAAQPEEVESTTTSAPA